MEIAQIIDDALEEHYSELGLPVPNWKRKKNPDWWVEYLKIWVLIPITLDERA